MNKNDFSFKIKLKNPSEYWNSIKDWFRNLKFEKPNFYLMDKKTILKISLGVFACIFVIGLLITLYNIRFKYDTKDIFFAMLDNRGSQLEDKYVFEKTLRIRDIFQIANTPTVDARKVVNNTVQSGKLDNEFIANNLKNYSYPPIIYKHSEGRSKISKTFHFVKVTKRNLLAKKYIDLYNKPYQLDKAPYTYVKLPNKAVLAYSIFNRNCGYIPNVKYDKSKTRFICGQGYLDINGKKGPNQLGVDLFDVGIFYTPAGYLVLSSVYVDKQAENYCMKGIGEGCFYYVKNYDRSYLVSTLKIIKTKLLLPVRTPNYIYLTKKGKLVYFNKYGYQGQVTIDNIRENFQLFKVSKRPSDFVIDTLFRLKFAFSSTKNDIKNYSQFRRKVNELNGLKTRKKGWFYFDENGREVYLPPDAKLNSKKTSKKNDK